MTAVLRSGVATAMSYLPNQAGAVIFHVAGDVDVPVLGPGYGPWAARGILLTWTAAAVACGYLAVRRRDA
ncbi:MAG: hypothetical protein JXA67_01795 [Micromonosporaceae bacterium]|nr:hypothetical protein [Micromonosporaceae bacterium]